MIVFLTKFSSLKRFIGMSGAGALLLGALTGELLELAMWISPSLLALDGMDLEYLHRKTKNHSNRGTHAGMWSAMA